ncbi:hypothetical protein DFJ63DRAFT_239974 [Scheffersomyces coipomensis]|uniref:uncharacterized protein n=1 Tax=Scheffersomyces coipomensis TaxID=1788519 RepID=UPI00315C73B0
MADDQLQVHNVLFDSPLPTDQPIIIGDNQIVENIESIYNSKVFKVLFQAYMGLLLCQYISVYACVPFDDIDNRPSICIITGIFIFISFGINACLLPTCSATIPSIFSFRCILFSAFLEFIGIILNVLCVVSTLNVKEMFSYEYDSQTKLTEKTNVTTYIQIISILCLVLSCLTFVVLFLNAVVTAQSLKNLVNRIDRREKYQEKQIQRQFSYPRHGRLYNY